jgi:hypothetical protein
MADAREDGGLVQIVVALDVTALERSQLALGDQSSPVDRQQCLVPNSDQSGTLLRTSECPV